MGDHIQLWDKILDSYVWSLTGEQSRCAVTIMLLAAPSGTVKTSIDNIAKRAHVSIQTVRSTMAHLVREKTIEVQPRITHTEITVCNYALYNPDVVSGQQIAAIRAPGPRSKPLKTWSTETHATIIAVLSDLSRKSGRKYGVNPTNGKHIAARLAEGYKPHDLMLVVWDRWLAWRNDPRWQQYLRPTTLFGPEKFETYLPQARANEVKLRGDEHKPRAGEQLDFLNGVEPEDLE